MQNRNLTDIHVLVVTLAREGSFVRAAGKLGITAPSLTRRVALLEKEIGVRLFERSTRRLELTAAGRLFVEQSQLSLAHAEQAWNLARFQAQVESGPYRIGYSPYTNSSILHLLHRLGSVKHATSEEPSNVVLETSDTSELVDRVLGGKLHAALCVGPVVDHDLWVQRTGSEAFAVCLPRSHRLAQKTGVSAHDLDRETVFWMPRSAQPRLYDRTMRYIRSLGVQAQFREVKSSTHAFECASRSFGLALLPQSATEHLTYSGITFRPLTDRYLRIETVLVMRNDLRHGKLKETVDDLLRQLLALRLESN